MAVPSRVGLGSMRASGALGAARRRCDVAAVGRSSVGPPPVGRMPSIGVESRSSRTTWPAWTSWIDELVLMISRWARAGSARALMSSGMT